MNVTRENAEMTFMLKHYFDLVFMVNIWNSPFLHCFGYSHSVFREGYTSFRSISDFFHLPSRFYYYYMSLLGSCFFLAHNWCLWLSITLRDQNSSRHIIWLLFSCYLIFFSLSNFCVCDFDENPHNFIRFLDSNSNSFCILRFYKFYFLFCIIIL